MPANAVHQASRRSVLSPVAEAIHSARASMVSTSSDCHSVRSTASNAASPTHGAGSIATSPRRFPPSRMLLGVSS
ncbi:MAG TPA: hypothetical protein VM688_01095, partial [Nocardioidaceae bacterium]|nr:hypothetical protein [Nocardioidaceae bacterium]